MPAHTILATLPGSGPHQRVQVALHQKPDGGLQIELRDQHFGEGIGWFDQRTMSLEPRQWQQLQALLGTKATSDVLNEQADATPATLPFPGPRTKDPRRPAASDA